MQTEIRRRIANLISNILSPFLISLAVILLLSFVSASGILDAIKWALISITLSVLPVFCFVFYLVRRSMLDAFFTNVRQQRTKIYLLAGLCAVAGSIILTFLKAPSMLVAALPLGFQPQSYSCV